MSTLRHDTYGEVSPLKIDLKGKHVLITGASKGVGRATALSYAAAGASGIVIAARSDLSSMAKELQIAAAQADRSPPKIVPLPVRPKRP